MRFSFIAAPSLNPTAQCAAPQTARRSRALTAHAVSTLGQLPASQTVTSVKGHFPRRITTATSNSVHISFRTRLVQWIRHRNQNHRSGNTVKVSRVNHRCTSSRQVFFYWESDPAAVHRCRSQPSNQSLAHSTSSSGCKHLARP